MHQLISAVNTNNTKIAVLAVNEVILFTIGSNSVSGTIKAVRTVNGVEKIADVVMNKPICAKTGEQIAISRKIATGASRSWRLIGWGRFRIIRIGKISILQKRRVLKAVLSGLAPRGSIRLKHQCMIEHVKEIVNRDFSLKLWTDGENAAVVS